MLQQKLTQEALIQIPTSTEDVLEWIDQRIGLMQHIRTAVITVAGLEKGTPRQPRVKAKHLQSKGKAEKGAAKALIIKALSTGPLAIGEILQRMQRFGWQTSSTNPRSLLGVTMRSFQKNGLVHRVGADWELSAKALKQQASDVDLDHVATPTS